VGYLLGAGARPIPLFPGDTLTLGREPQGSIFLDDALASRRHAALECAADGQVSLKDLGSRNGTYLNEEFLLGRRAPVRSGDTFRIGGKVFTFISHDASLEAPQAGARSLQQIAGAVTIASKLFMKDGRVVEQKDLGETIALRETHSRPPDAAAPGPALSGNLSDQGLPQIVQFLHTSAMTGELKVSGARFNGVIAFDKGQLCHAEAGEFQGEFAVYACAMEQQGSFQFFRLDALPPREQNVKTPTAHVIFECCRRMDEAGRGEAGGSGPSV
jgi:hypothetical protein